MICSDNSDLENQQQPGLDVRTKHYFCMRTSEPGIVYTIIIIIIIFIFKLNQWLIAPKGATLLLLSMLLISRFKDFFLCSIHKLSFPSFSIFSFFLWLPIYSSVSQIIKELCSSSSVISPSISSQRRQYFFQNMTNPIGFSTYDSK